MTVTKRPARGKEYADPYEEEVEEMDLDDLVGGMIRHITVDLTYRTNKATRKTVRMIGASEPADSTAERFGIEDDGWLDFYDGDDHLAYHPEDRVLKSLQRDGPSATLARDGRIIKAERVQYPENAVIDGARQDGVEATVYYRSSRSEGITSMDVEVTDDYDRDAMIRARRLSDGQRIEIRPRYDRKIEKRYPDQYLGRVCRIEYPRGHRFTVDVEGLADDRVDESTIESIESALSGKGSPFQYDDATVSVSHDGRLERE
jgi:hypothetical protein